MINRINLILQAKNITAKQFAEEIGIQPSGMSHILSGRNNPSLEFVSKVIRRYPEIDANWLLLGKGEMYTSGAVESPAVSEPTLFVPPAPSPAPIAELEPTDTPEPKTIQYPKEEEIMEIPESEKRQDLPVFASVEREQEQEKQKKSAPIIDDGRRLMRILFFYDDHTFSEYRPEN